MKRDLTNTMICWTPRSERIALIAWPDSLGSSKAYEMSIGACVFDSAQKTFEDRKKEVFIEAVHIIVRDGVPAAAVHECLMGLEEYQDGCSEDMPLTIRTAKPSTLGNLG